VKDAASPRAGVAIVAVSALIFSTGGLIVRSFQVSDSWTIIFWRSLAAGAFLLAFIALRHGRQAITQFRRMGWPGVGVGACLAASSIALVVALNLTTVADVLVTMSSSPLIAAVLGSVALRERVPARTWAAILATMAGIAVMVSDSYGRGSLAGNLIALVIAASMAVSIVIMRRHRGISMVPAMCLGAVMAGAIALPLAAPAAPNAHDAWLLLLFGAGQLGVGMALLAIGTPLVRAATAALLLTLEPILGPVWVWLVIGEAPGAAALAGGGVVLASLIAHTVYELSRANSAKGG
jgi:drug/metabolite transporter (DMT)-like permease